MNDYEDKMFQFLTEEENLKGMIIAKNQFPGVREKLIQNFWNQVYKNVKTAILNKQEWEVVLEGNINLWHSKLYIREKEGKTRVLDNGFPSFIFCLERLTAGSPYVAFWMNQHESTDYDLAKVHEYLSLKNYQKLMYDGTGSWFLLWREYQNFNLANDESLIQIVPTKMGEKAKEFSDALLELFNNHLEDYDHFRTHCKK